MLQTAPLPELLAGTWDYRRPSLANFAVIWIPPEP